MNPTSMLRNVRYHMPKIRPLDSAIGIGAGALGGLGVAAMRDAMSDDEETDNKRYWTHGLAGAGLGFGAANLVGDRARRYISNNVTPFGYSGRYVGDKDTAALSKELGVPGTEQTDFLRPRSWAHFYRTAIQDRPAEATMKFMTDDRGAGLTPFNAMARQELLRRHMGLPIRSEDAIFRSTGNRWFQPRVSHTGDVVSGGIPGNYEHVEFNPKAWDKFRSAATGTASGSTKADPKAFVQAVMSGTPIVDAITQHGGKYNRGVGGFNAALKDTGDHFTTPKEIPNTQEQTFYPQVEKTRWRGYPWNRYQETYYEPASEPVTKKVTTGMKPNPAYSKLDEDPFSGLFARHGTQLDPQTNTARVFDHWDFGLQPLENELLKEYMQSAMTGGSGMDETIPYQVRKDWDKQQIADWFGAGSKDPDPTKRDHMMALLKRVILNDVLGQGGVVFDQEFNFDDPGNPRPIYFNPNQTDVGLKYLEDRKTGG